MATTTGENGIWARVKDALTTRGWSMSELARRSKVTQSAISKIKVGHRPTPRTIDALALALGVRPGWLATGEGEREIEADYPPTSIEWKMLRLWRRLPPEMQEPMLRVIQEIAARRQEAAVRTSPEPSEPCDTSGSPVR